MTNKPIEQDKPLDKTDRRILRELQADGRLSNTALSRLINLSPTPIVANHRYHPIHRFVVCHSLRASFEYTLLWSCRRGEEWGKDRAIFGESVAVEIDACGDLFEAGWHIHRYSFVREVLNVH